MAALMKDRPRYTESKVVSISVYHAFYRKNKRQFLVCSHVALGDTPAKRRPYYPSYNRCLWIRVGLRSEARAQ